MKKYIKASNSISSLLKSNDGMFELVKVEGVNRHDNTPFKLLETRNYGLAKKHMVEVKVHGQGSPVQCYSKVEVAYGLRGRADTLEETQEYIDVLESALSFAYEVEDYLLDNGWLK